MSTVSVAAKDTCISVCVGVCVGVSVYVGVRVSRICYVSRCGFGVPQCVYVRANVGWCMCKCVHSVPVPVFVL